MHQWRVGIVGGGPGGLMSAYDLQKSASAPLAITIFEATERCGGKILTPHFNNAPIRYEAGAAEFYDYSHFDEDPLKDLILELGLPISRMGGSAFIFGHQKFTSLDDITDYLGHDVAQAFKDFDNRAREEMTPQEFYHSDDPEGVTGTLNCDFDSRLSTITHSTARKLIEMVIHSDLATEPAQTTACYGLQNYLMNDPAYMQLYGIVGGNERLPQELAARSSASFRMSSPVREVLKVDESLRVVSEVDGQPCYDDFDYVIIALPHNQLQSVSFQSTRLSQAINTHYNTYHFPAHYLRISALFERPFWREEHSDSFWMLEDFGGCCLYDESSRDPSCTHGVLGWLIAGEAAAVMSELSDEALIGKALETLTQLDSQSCSGFIEGQVHRWSGAVNAIPAGKTPQPHDRRHQPEPIEHPNLFFVGDYLFDSTLNGVLDSAQYVAAWITGQIADQALSQNGE
ncbi:flavin monoamine oxidase family protein [Stratiformator vulcanicus]|uniref:Tryptophan 2-monooxygenase n=1 Tax=Stratiformator vulcanicus TaxID=2527980 RepID=A0A517R5Z0_9PLAN|nr:NAD(P)/FAD-dependent oxidoreductase [Stratiformator vulcanicus]QDT39280.1 protoporphyrinogen oxidase [Stratiformator vulcanicus]